MLAAGDLDPPLPGRGRTAERWAALAGYGRRDLCLGRLAEGHTDAAAILAEAGRRPEPGCLYGVWASRHGGGGARLVPERTGGWSLTGTVAFCSGAGLLDRALVVADRPGDGAPVLIDVGVDSEGVSVDQTSWPALGMDASASLDVTFVGVAVAPADLVGPPRFYTDRPGFALGGAGVAAVWLGGAAAAFEAARGVVAGPDPDPHRLARLGGLHTGLAAADALLARSAAAVDASPLGDHAVTVATCRSAAEALGRRMVDEVPLVTGPSPLTRERGLARRLADLQVYIRQHHGGADLAALGRLVVGP